MDRTKLLVLGAAVAGVLFFELRGYNAYAKTSQDRDANTSWDIRAVELPPGWQPVGVVQQGSEPILYACHPQPPRNWGQNRITIRP